MDSQCAVTSNWPCIMYHTCRTQNPGKVKSQACAIGARGNGQEESVSISTEGEVELCILVRLTLWDISPKPNWHWVLETLMLTNIHYRTSQSI